MYAVVYLLVYVIWTACDDDYLSFLGSCLSDYLHGFFRYRVVVSLKRLVSLVHSVGYPALDVVAAESLSQNLYDVFPDVKVEIGMNEIILVESRVVCHEQLGIIGNYGTVEVVVAAALVQIVAHAGVEYEVHALSSRFSICPWVSFAG